MTRPMSDWIVFGSRGDPVDEQPWNEEAVAGQQWQAVRRRVDSDARSAGFDGGVHQELAVWASVGRVVWLGATVE